MTSAKPILPVWAALLGSGAAGALTAAQSRINGGLSQHLGDGYVTAAVSFGSGTLILFLVIVLNRRAREGFALLRRELTSGHLPRWSLIGGAFGAFFVLGQGLVATVLGVALFTVGVVAGQVFGGLVIDRIGIGPGGRVDPTLPRVFGTALAILAVIFSVVADLVNPHASSGQIWLIVIPVLIGTGVSMQAAVNGLVRSAAQSALTATFVSFLVGTAILVAIAAISVAANGWPTDWPKQPLYYSGGVLGIVFIALAAMLVRTAGVLLLSMSNVAGQLLASVAIEAGLPLVGGVSVGLLVGAGIALIAVAVAAVPARQNMRPARPAHPERPAHG